MAITHDDVNELCKALARARRALRRFPAGHPASEPIVGSILAIAAHVLHAGPLALVLSGQSVIWNGETAFTERADELEIRRMTAAGITRLELAQDTSASALAELLAILEADDDEVDLVERFRASPIDGIELGFDLETADAPHAPVTIATPADPQNTRLARRADRPRNASARAVRPALEQELVLCLPVRAAKRVLDELASGRAEAWRPRALALLARLMQTLLARGDLHGALLLLEQADRCSALADIDRTRLETLVLAAADDVWLERVLGESTAETVPALCAFLVRVQALAPRVRAHPRLASHPTIRLALELVERAIALA